MTKYIKKLLKQVPGVYYLYTKLRDAIEKQQLQKKSRERIFTEYYQNNTWHGKESVSGTGSDTEQTALLVKKLPEVLETLEIERMLDLPCGDFNWMKKISLTGVQYTGGDLVSDLIKENTEKFATSSIRFEVINLISDDLPDSDLILTRDCLVHFSFSDIYLALANIVNADIKYLATTTYTDCKRNHDIATGQWRKLNLTLPPFNFPQPLVQFLEGSTERGGEDRDKCLSVWAISDLKTSQIN